MRHPDRNITMKSFELKDPENNDEVLGSFKRTVNENNPYDVSQIDKTKVITYKEVDGKKVKLSKGKKYKLAAEYTFYGRSRDSATGEVNNTIARTNTHNVAWLDDFRSYDENVGDYNIFDYKFQRIIGNGQISSTGLAAKEIIKADGTSSPGTRWGVQGLPLGGPGAGLYNKETAKFEWETEIPDTKKGINPRKTT